MPKHRPLRRADHVNPLAAKLQRVTTATQPLSDPLPPALPPPPRPNASMSSAALDAAERKEAFDSTAWGEPVAVAASQGPRRLHSPAEAADTSPKPAANVGTQGTDDTGAGVSPGPAMSGAVVSSVYAPGGIYTFRLRLRGSTASKYADAALRASCDPEEVMESTLTRASDRLHSDTPLTFDDDQRRQIMDALGTSDPESIVRHIHNLVSASAVTANGTPVSTLRFSAQQLERVASRCVAGETLTDKLQEYADYGINLQTGLA